MAIITLTIKDIKTNVSGKSTGGTTAVMQTGDKTNVSATVAFKAKWEHVTLVDTAKDGEKPKTKTASGEDALNFSLTLQRISFSKQMYSPNTIQAVIQISPIDNKVNGPGMTTTAISRNELLKAFLNRQVEMKCDDDVVGSDYYIHALVPVYKADSLFVTLHIFSPDKTMTVKTDCRTFVAQKLKAQILPAVVPLFRKPWSKADEDKLSFNADNMKTLLSGDKEHIFPYLVQYNESAYDFLARTANRWGEFLYWENGRLNLGYGTTVTEVTHFNSYTYLNMTSADDEIGNVNPEVPYDKNLLNRAVKKGEYNTLRGYLPAYCSDGCDLWLMKKVSAILGHEGNIWDLIVDTLVDDTVDYLVSKGISDTKTEKIDSQYFTAVNSAVNKERYNDDQNELNPFSEYKSLVDASVYLTTLRGEVKAARNMIQIDLDTSWQNLRLGDVIRFKDTEYIIVSIVGTQPDQSVTFTVTAVQKDDNRFYPVMLPSGHVRQATAQTAVVTDATDPLHQNRVRVRYDWQQESEEASPWLKTLSPVASEGHGFQGAHYKGDKVLIQFADGNIERPYVAGFIPDEFSLNYANKGMLLTSPGGQSLKINDSPLGATNLLTGLTPGAKLITSMIPSATDLFGYSNDTPGGFQSQNFGGSIELGDKYGIWSIKGSTDGRNVSIKSAWGDVKINAWSGITISAPNGDVKIQGKNVTIEAGNKLTLVSGKNISNQFLTLSKKTWSTTAVLSAVGRKVQKKMVEIVDLGIVRNVIETFVRPIEGTLEIKSNRYLQLAAGGCTTGLPVTAYASEDKALAANRDKTSVVLWQGKGIKEMVAKVSPLSASIDGSYRTAHNLCVAKKGALEQAVNALKHLAADDGAVCKTYAQLSDALWGGADKHAPLTDADLDFQANVSIQAADITYEVAVRLTNLPLPATQQAIDDAKNTIVSRRTVARANVVKAANALLDAIWEMRNQKITRKTIAKTVGRFWSVRPKDHITIFEKACTNANLNPLRYFTVPEGDKALGENLQEASTAANHRQLTRMIAINLLDELGFNSIRKGPNEHAAPDEVPTLGNVMNDNIWPNYVASINNLPEGKKGGLLAGVADTAKKMLDVSVINSVKAVKDPWAWSDSKQGAILFSSDADTYQLKPGIGKVDVDTSKGRLGDVEGSEAHAILDSIRQTLNGM